MESEGPKPRDLIEQDARRKDRENDDGLVWESEVQLSVAISLKRIADELEVLISALATTLGPKEDQKVGGSGDGDE